MKILYLDWNSFGKESVIKALKNLGHDVERVEFDHEKDSSSKDYEEQAVKVLSYKYFDLVFSMNYFSVIAKACHENDVIYMSWLYDSPLLQVWDTTAYYPECYIFSFDQKQTDGLRKEGIRNVYYMPLAVDAEELDLLKATEEQEERFRGDVSFVGKMYDEKTEIGKGIKKSNLDFLKGFGDAIINAQSQIQSTTFIEEVLEVQYIKDIINKSIKRRGNSGCIASMTKEYANYYLAPSVTLKERRRMVQVVSNEFQINVYTKSSLKRYKKAIHKGLVDYYKEMPLVFRYSKVNLNMTLRSIQSGIPLRCWDVMGAGGFLLTDYQEDLLKHFIPGVDFDYFLDEKDMLKKIGYYLEHDEERNIIAKNGYNKVKKYHTYEIRLNEMFQIVEEGDRSK
jgi:spore maturation protein CgeB